MRALQRLRSDCLGFNALSEGGVASIYDYHQEASVDYLRDVVRRLCLSHERLRAELKGAELLIGCPHCGDACDLL